MLTKKDVKRIKYAMNYLKNDLIFALYKHSDKYESSGDKLELSKAFIYQKKINDIDKILGKLED